VRIKAYHGSPIWRKGAQPGPTMTHKRARLTVRNQRHTTARGTNRVHRALQTVSLVSACDVETTPRLQERMLHKTPAAVGRRKHGSPASLHGWPCLHTLAQTRRRNAP
jgi:hypothetical protein